MAVLVGLDVAGVLQTTHDALIAALDAAGHDVPDRRYITLGEIAIEGCGEFVTSLQGVGVGGIDGGGEASPPALRSLVAQRTVTMQVILTRCWKTEVNPLPSKMLTAMGLTLAADAGALLGAAIVARRDGTLAAKCDDVLLGPVLPIGPEGLSAGVALTIIVEA